MGQIRIFDEKNKINQIIKVNFTMSFNFNEYGTLL